MEVTLRPWRMEDAEQLFRLAGDRGIARWLRDVFPHPYVRADAEEFLHSCLSAGETCLFRAIQADGRLAGSVSLTCGSDVYRRSAELGYWLGTDFHGQGIMTKAVKQICLMGFDRWDIARIYAEPFADNAPSRRVLEKAGFRLEGVLRQSVYKWGQLQDSCVYARLRGE